MKDKEKQERPVDLHNVRVTPEFRDEPDIDKLARALIAVALQIAQEKEAKEQALVNHDNTPADGENSDGLI